MVKRTGCIAILLLALVGLPAHAQQPPDYCTDFSPAACARMKAVIDSKTRPAYCQAGPVPTSRGNPLSTEQLRICYTMADPAGPEMRPIAGNPGAQQKQLTEDTRAMVRQTWTTYSEAIKNTEVALRCNLVNQSVAAVAVRNVEATMHDTLTRAGLFNETELNVEKTAETSLQAGQQAVMGGACTALTPLAKDQLRDTVLALTRR